MCLVRPQPVVAHRVPAGKSSFSLGRHMADTVWENQPGVASFSSVVIVDGECVELGVLENLQSGADCGWGLGGGRRGAEPGRGATADHLSAPVRTMARSIWHQEPEARPRTKVQTLNTLLSALPHHDGVPGWSGAAGGVRVLARVGHS